MSRVQFLDTVRAAYYIVLASWGCETPLRHNQPGMEVIMPAIATNETARHILANFGHDSVVTRLAKHNMPSTEPEADAQLLLKVEGVRTQGEMTALAVNLTGGKVQPDEVTSLLKVAFPSSKIGQRHGPHYLSLCRTGKIEGVDDDIIIPKKARKAKAKKVEEPGPDASGDSAPAEVKLDVATAGNVTMLEPNADEVANAADAVKKAQAKRRRAKAKAETEPVDA